MLCQSLECHQWECILKLSRVHHSKHMDSIIYILPGQMLSLSPVKNMMLLFLTVATLISLNFLFDVPWELLLTSSSSLNVWVEFMYVLLYWSIFNSVTSLIPLSSKCTGPYWMYSIQILCRRIPLLIIIYVKIPWLDLLNKDLIWPCSPPPPPDYNLETVKLSIMNTKGWVGLAGQTM